MQWVCQEAPPGGDRLSPQAASSRIGWSKAVDAAGDVAEVENPGVSPERVGLQIFLKEKQAKYNTPEYLPQAS
ncbi:hypothetical protein DIPPA_15592 [Diplonema papillatum]|nr:hypothetical protein DIPPA_15592 [Diplonema papillatum]